MDLSLLKQENGGIPVAELLQGELLSPRGSQPVRQTWGHTGKLGRIFTNLLKSSSKCLYCKALQETKALWRDQKLDVRHK